MKIVNTLNLSLCQDFFIIANFIHISFKSSGCCCIFMIPDQQISHGIDKISTHRIFIDQFSINIELCFFCGMVAGKCYMHPFTAGNRLFTEGITGSQKRTKFHIRIQIKNTSSGSCLLKQIFFIRCTAEHITVTLDPCHQCNVICSSIDCTCQFYGRT